LKIVLGIPCYNCAPQIKRVLKKLQSEDLNDINEIILIDNVSQDSTLSTIQSEVDSFPVKLKKKTIVFQNNTNYGLGGSFKGLVNYCEKEEVDYLAVLHGDDQAEVSDLVQMISHLKSLTNRKSIDALLGARFMPDAKLMGYSKIRKYGNIFFNKLFSVATGKKVYDIGSGLNIYKINSLPLTELKLWPNHIAFDVHLLLLFCRKDKNMEFYPIYWRSFDEVSNAGNISTGLKILKILFSHLLKVSRLNPRHDISLSKTRVL